MDQALICKSLLYRSLVSLPKLDSIIDSVCITHKSSPNLSNLQITYSSVAGWFIETLILPCSCCSRRIQRMKGKFSSSSSLPRRIIMPQWSASLACRNYFNSFFVFQKTPWNQHLSNPTHWNLTPSSLFGKKLVPRKQGLMAWTLKKEKGSCRVRGCWRRRKELSGKFHVKICPWTKSWKLSMSLSSRKVLNAHSRKKEQHENIKYVDELLPQTTPKIQWARTMKVIFPLRTSSTQCSWLNDSPGQFSSGTNSSDIQVPSTSWPILCILQNSSHSS